MSGLGTAINNALRALEANQLALAVASNNISNSQTPGFARQRLVTQPAASLGGTFPIGAGVQVMGTEAIRDRLIERRLNEEISSHSEDSVKQQTLADIEVLFNETGNTGLMSLMADFFNSFHGLSTEPTSINRRQIVLTNATKLANAFNARAEDLQNVQIAMDRALRDDVDQVNSLVGDIAKISSQIIEREVTGQPAHELRDQRTNLVQKLSEVIEVHELESNGNYQLSIAGGRPLVFNATATPLTIGTATNGMTIVQFGIDDITSELSGAQIGAHISLRDQTVPRYMAMLDQLAYEIAQQVNTIHTTGYDLDGIAGVDLFAPLTSVADAARSFAVNTAVSGDPKKLAMSSGAAGTDNQVAMQLGNLLHAPVFTGGSVTDQYRNFIFTIGTETASAGHGVKQHEALLHQLQNRWQEVSGVSIDEESIKILEFQRAYEANARVVRVVDELLQLTLTLGQR